MAQTEHSLIVGASGVIGTAVIESLAARPDAVVPGISRRRPETEASFHFVPLDLDDARGCSEAAAELPPIGAIVYAAVAEAEGLVGGWTDPALMQRNLDMLANIVR